MLVPDKIYSIFGFINTWKLSHKYIILHYLSVWNMGWSSYHVGCVVGHVSPPISDDEAGNHDNKGRQQQHPPSPLWAAARRVDAGCWGDDTIGSCCNSTRKGGYHNATRRLPRHDEGITMSPDTTMELPRCDEGGHGATWWGEPPQHDRELPWQGHPLFVCSSLVFFFFCSYFC
jgi:hypothetical protein